MIKRFLAIGLATLAIGTLTAAPTAAAPDMRISVPRGSEVAGMTSTYLLFDRRVGASIAGRAWTTPIRSASLVKVLIALDYLFRNGGYIHPNDGPLLNAMLQTSHDGAASVLWDRGGRTAIVHRMKTRIGLAQTQPPADPNWWGYTTTSAADTVQTYRYLMEWAPAAYRDSILNGMKQARQCAADGFDQYFGIPRAIGWPWAIKQGWSGFRYGQTCGRSEQYFGPTQSSKEPYADLSSPAMHTSGMLGAEDRYLLAILTLHPAGTSWETAAAGVTAVTGEADLARYPVLKPVPGIRP